MDLQLSGKLALVTASTAGIGLAIGSTLAGEGDVGWLLIAAQNGCASFRDRKEKGTVDWLRLVRARRLLTAGLLANNLVPITYAVVIALLMRSWHNPDETQNILVSLVLVATMPIAGSSTAWTQNTHTKYGTLKIGRNTPWQ